MKIITGKKKGSHQPENRKMKRNAKRLEDGEECPWRFEDWEKMREVGHHFYILTISLLICGTESESGWEQWDDRIEIRRYKF